MARTQVQSELLAVNSISGTIIADNAITATHIATNAISGTLVQDGGIVTVMIAANNVTATKIVTDAVQTRHIADDQVTAAKLANSINTDIATGPAALPKAGGTMTGALIGTTARFNGTTTAGLVISSSSTASSGFKIYNNSSTDTANLNNHFSGPMVFSTANTERMRITAAGNVGIGNTTPDSYYSNSNQLVVGSGAARQGITIASSTTTIGQLAFADGTSGDARYEGSVLYNHNDNHMELNTNHATRIYIDSTGRVGINRTPAISNSKLEVGGADNVPLINVEASGDTAGFGIGSNKLKVYYGTTEIGGWSSSGRFNSGNIYLNGESSNSQIEAGNVHFKVGAGIWMSGSSSLDLQLQVPVTGVGVSTAAKLDAPSGDWYTNDGSVSSLSDSRLKKDITTLTDGIDIVKQLRPVTFKYDDTTLEQDGSKSLGTADGITRYGFVAQEVESVASQYVVSKEGKVNGEIVNDLKSLSQTRMIPMLVKAIQELEARLKTLEG